MNVSKTDLRGRSTSVIGGVCIIIIIIVFGKSLTTIIEMLDVCYKIFSIVLTLSMYHNIS